MATKPTEKRSVRSASTALPASDDVGAHERARRVACPPARQMVRAARRLMYAGGLRAVTFAALNRELGVAIAAPFYYFGTKGRLLAEVLRLEYAERVEVLARETGRAESREELLAGIAGVVRHLVEPRGNRAPHEVIFEIGALSLSDHDVREIDGSLRRTYRDALARVLSRHQRDATITLAGSTRCVAALIIVIAEGLASESIVDADSTIDDALAGVSLAVDQLVGEVS